MKGVNQGDVLPPILFALYTDELLERLEQTKVGLIHGLSFNSGVHNIHVAYGLNMT